MSVLRKANNIFNQRILPQSLFSQQVQKDYEIDGIKIQGSWLQNTKPLVYKSSVKSAIDLAQKKQHYQQMKQEQNKGHFVRNSNDVIKINQIQSYMEHFQQIDQNNNKIMEPNNWRINAENLVLQKISKFWGIFQRKCKIIDKQLHVYSQKNKKQMMIDLKNYKIQLQQKPKQNQQTSSLFPWLQNNKIRLFLHGDNIRQFCIYGQQDLIRGIVKKIKIQNINIKQIDIFKLLNQQYNQKILNLFTIKLRSYGNDAKQKQNIHNNLNIALELLQKSHLLDGIIQDQKKHKRQNSILNNSQIQQQEQYKSQTASLKTNQNLTNIILTPTKLQESSQISNLMSSIVNRKKPTTKQPRQLNNTTLRKSPSRYNYDDLQNEEQVYQVSTQNCNMNTKQPIDGKQEIIQEQLISRNSQKSQQLFIINNQIKRNSSQISNSQNQNESADPISISENQQILSSNLQPVKPKRKSFIKKQDDNPYDLKQMEMTHFVYIQHFKSLFPYSANQINLTFYQSVIPQLQYLGMKMPVCTLQKLTLTINPSTKLFQSQKPLIFKVSQYAQKLGVFFNNNVKQIQQQFDIRLKTVVYAVDLSQLLYFKTNDRVQCAGQLKIIVSPDKIQLSQWTQKTTVQFLAQWIQKKEQNREQKYRFIDYKRRSLQVCQKWNNKMMKKIINRVDSRQFGKSIFYGLSETIYKKLLLVVKQKEINEIDYKTQKNRNKKFIITPQYQQILQFQIKKLKIFDLRVFIKIDKLIDLVINGRKNYHLQKRIDHVRTYLHAKYGKQKIQKFIVAYTIVTLKKVQNILMTLQNANHIQIFFDEYFDVQYEVDAIMESVSTYFN